jgi:hypothetical protein
MVLVKASDRSEAGEMPSPEMLAKMGAFNAELIKAGAMLAGEGLAPTSQGTRIQFRGGKPTVVDGPFTESKELVGGFWIIQAKSKDEAIEWMRRAPFDNEQIEIRRVFEVEDFGLTPADEPVR